MGSMNIRPIVLLLALVTTMVVIACSAAPTCRSRWLRALNPEKAGSYRATRLTNISAGWGCSMRRALLA